MPDLTVRNAVRYALSHPERTVPDKRIQGAIETVRALAGGSSEIEPMREYVRQMADRVLEVDRIGTSLQQLILSILN